MTPEEREQWAREICTEACRLELKRPITLEEVQAVQVISRLESTYGNGWSDASGGKGSNNWGAIQWIKGSSSDIVSGSFVTVDHHRDGTAYRYPYCSYATPVDGCRHVVRLLERMGALALAKSTRRLRAVSAQLGRKGYYEGSGANLTEAQAGHFKACLRNFATIIAACGDSPKGLSNADTETPQEGAPCYFPENQGDESQDHIGQETRPSGDQGAGGDSAASEETPSEEAGDSTEPLALVNPWPDDPTTEPASPISETKPTATPGPIPMRAPPVPLSVAFLVAIATAILAAFQCASCTPGELRATRAIVTDAAVVGLDVCLLLEEISDPPTSAARRICTDGERLINRINAAQSADQMARGMGGAGGSKP